MSRRALLVRNWTRQRLLMLRVTRRTDWSWFRISTALRNTGHRWLRCLHVERLQRRQSERRRWVEARPIPAGMREAVTHPYVTASRIALANISDSSRTPFAAGD